MIGNVTLDYGATQFSTSPSLKGYDMVVLNIDENNYVSSPYARIADESKMTSRANGTYTFSWTASRTAWRYGSTSNYYTAEQLLSTYGIEVYYASVTGFSDAPKAGDTITVVLIKDGDPNANEKMNVSLVCDMTRSGSVMEAACPLVKPSERQSVADSLLNDLYGMEYQPYSATTAIIDPSAEVGDTIVAYGNYSGIYTQELNFDSMMSSDIGAPIEEEVDNEMEYQSSSERNYNRKFADIAAEFLIKADEISARVTREGTGEGFSWSLIESAFTIRSGNRDVLKVDSTGAHVTGEITAESGYIGTASKGFKITPSAIYNSVTPTDSEQALSLSNINDEQSKNGVYVGTDGIYLGGGKFKVTKAGALTAKSADLEGKITSKEGVIGGFTIKENYLYNGRSSLTSSDAGVYLGTTGISVGSDDTHGFVTKSDGTITVKHGMSSINDTTNTSGLFIGTTGIALGGGKFKVTSSGKVTAKDLDITGGSIKLGGTDSAPVFQVTSGGAVTASNLTISGGSIKIGGTSSAPVFSVSSSGAVSASNLSITGGSISIGSNFSVDSSGNLTANNGTFGGNVYAKNIQYGGNYGTFSGLGITPSSITGADTGPLVDAVRQRLGWANDYNNATGQNTSNYPNYFRAGHFTTPYSYYGPAFIVSNSQGYNEVHLETHYHTFTESNGTIKIGQPTTTQGSFSIAATKTYKDMVAALTISSSNSGITINESSDGKFYNISATAKNAAGTNLGTWSGSTGTNVWSNGYYAGEQAHANDYTNGYNAAKRNVSVTLSNSGWENHGSYQIIYFYAKAWCDGQQMDSASDSAMFYQ